MDEVFPLRQDVDYQKLKLTSEGEYSVTRRRDSDRIVGIMSHIIGSLSDKTITDATGCVGGDTIQFGLHFKNVESIELNSDNFEILKNNVSVYKLQNINLHLGDAVKLYNWNTDVLYIDPPWGGPSYRDVKELDLFISDVRIDKWLEEVLLRKNRPQYIFLKLPHNFNFRRFNFLSNVDFIKPYRVRGYILVEIKVHMPKS